MSRLQVIIQARLTSSRLPGKVLKPFGAHPVLYHVYHRCLHGVRLIVDKATAGVIVAIPSTPANDPLATWLETERIPFYRGPEDDVLARYVIGAAPLAADGIAFRVTADCPLIEPAEIPRLARELLGHGDLTGGYIYNRAAAESAPARGLDVEVMRAQALFDTAKQPHLTAQEREHVTQWLRRPEHLAWGAGGDQKHPTHGMRWTLDTEEDYAWFCRLAQHVNTEPPHPTTDEVLAYIKETGDVLYEPEA